MAMWCMLIPRWKSLNVLVVRVQSLSVNVLPVTLLSLSECSVSRKYEYWHRVRWKERKGSQNTEPPH